MISQFVKKELLTSWVSSLLCLFFWIWEQPGQGRYVMRNLFIIGSLQFCNDSTIASLEANQNRPYISQMLRYILQIGKIFLLSMWNIP